MEKLSLEIFDLTGTGSKYARLPEDSSITITSTSEIFASGDIWSHSFTLNVIANADIFGTSGDMHGSRLHEQLHNRRARLWVDGLPLYLGYLKLDEDAEVDEKGNVDLSFEGGQKTFDDLIKDGKANQVPMMSDVQIGMALWRKRWTCVEVRIKAWRGKETYSHVLTHEVNPDTLGDENGEYTYFVSDGEDDGTSVQQYPRMVFPKGSFYNMDTRAEETINCLNTDTPYDDSHPYCNIALCYQKYGYTVTQEVNGQKTTRQDYTSEPSAERGYEVMPANRVNSAPNFFVIYWLRALMKHLGIYIEENQMMNVEDLRRLFFVNSNCAYEETQYLRSPKYDGRYGKYEFSGRGPLVAEYFGDLVVEGGRQRWDGITNLVNASDCKLQIDSCTVDGQANWEGIKIAVSSIGGMSREIRAYYDGYDKITYGKYRDIQKNQLLHRAIASSDCFPNVDISEVISALENGFGIRFLFDDAYKRVRIVLLRNIFRCEEVQDVRCDIINESKTENPIRGFRLTYGDSDDTQFNYKGFSDLQPRKDELWIDNSDKHDYSRWNLNADYANLIQHISAFDITCYVTPNNGNAYGIKVDKDAKLYDELHPSLFEYAGFMNAEDGDCTGEDETIETITAGFKPAIMNDVNFEVEKANKGKVREQRFALFVDETMRPRRPDLEDLPNGKRQPGVKSYDDSDAVYNVDTLYSLHGPKAKDGTQKMVSGGIVAPGVFSVVSDMYVEATFPSMSISGYASTTHLSNVKISGTVRDGYRLYLQDNFEPNDDGVCPVEKHDWGLTLGIMRGSGNDAYVDYSGDPDDDEGNDTWDIVPGSNATAHPDTCDSYGNMWDYNGSGEGTLRCQTAAEAKTAMQRMWPKSNVNLVERTSKTYILQAEIRTIKNDAGDNVSLLFATFLADWSRPWEGGTTRGITRYAQQFSGMSSADMYAYDKSHHSILIEVGSSYERRDTLLALQLLAFFSGREVNIDGGDNGVGVTNGRFSLKLRAEKLNPYYKKKNAADVDTTRQYLEITNKDLRNRGLCDQFYKEYSYWVRNARIAKLVVRMELSQFLSIDKTKRVTIGDFTGFIKKMEFTVSNKNGLGNVAIELMYI